MKLLWFHLMPYPDLPSDFAAKHASVRVDIDPALFEPRRAHALYNDYLDELEAAADLGFDGVCVDEHHASADGLMPSPNLIAAALARSTRDTAIVLLGNSLALYEPPTRVAEEIAMIDCISGGRVVAGFALGTPMDACFAYGRNPSQLRQRYLEAHDLVMRAWTETAPFSFNGRFHQLRYVNTWPRPVQQPHPPVWIPDAGSVEAWRLCGAHDYLYSHLSFFGHKAGESALRGFWREMESQGRDRNPYRAGFLQLVGVAETRREAEDLYREPAEHFYGRCLQVDPRFASPPGYTSEATRRANVETIVARGAAPDFDAIVEEGFVIIGSPDEVAEQLREVALTLHVGHLMLLLHFGDMGRDLTLHNTELFARRVMPQLVDLFDDQWNDHWWPRPLTSRQRAPARELPA